MALKDATNLYAQVLALPWEVESWGALEVVAKSYAAQFEQTCDDDDIARAIHIYEYILRQPQDCNSIRADFTSKLGSCLLNRFMQSGNPDDLSTAIRCQQDALELSPGDWVCHHSLALSLLERSKHTHHKDDLTAALNQYQRALELQEHADLNLGNTLNNFATCFAYHFEQTGDKESLATAIGLSEQALEHSHLDRPSRCTILYNLGIHLDREAQRTGNDQLLKKAIRLYREAVSCSASQAQKATALLNLAQGLAQLFATSKSPEHMTEANRLNRQVLKMQQGPWTGSILINLMKCYSTSFEHSYKSAELWNAIGFGQEALKVLPLGHPRRTGAVVKLAECIFIVADFLREGRFTVDLSGSQFGEGEISNMIEDITNQVMNMLREATLPSPDPLSDRLDAARKWRTISGYYKHPSQLESLRKTLDIIDESVAQSRSLEKLYQLLSEDRHKQEVPAIASDAAALAIEHGDIREAVTLLERGRAIIFTRLGHYRQGFDDVDAKAPELALCLKELSAELEGLVVKQGTAVAVDCAAVGGLKALGTRYYEVRQEWVKTVDEIRQVEGLSTFLRPKSFEQLQRAAVNGPVVLINVNESRSDAIIMIHTHDPILVPLPHVTPEAVKVLAGRFAERPAELPDRLVLCMLREIWAILVEPIVVGLLGATTQTGSRIWWCPTGAASRLPLHAAGPYALGEQNLGDRFTSSYTPTLDALIRARRNKAPVAAAPQPETSQTILVVGQPDTPNERPLPNVMKEVDALRRHAPSATVLVSSSGTREAVLAGLREPAWLHLACHGHYNAAEPFRSHFSMHNGSITLLDIIANDLPHADLAFLSACHSAQVHEDLPDKVLHPAAGIMAAGYKSVAGTMWAFEDSIGSALANKFYARMLGGEGGPTEYTDSAAVLREAFNDLKDEGVKIPWTQRMNVVHYGA